MSSNRRFVVQIGSTVQRSNSIELATTHLGAMLYASHDTLRRQLLQSGVAIAINGNKQGYIFDTQFVTNDSNQLK